MLEPIWGNEYTLSRLAFVGIQNFALKLEVQLMDHK